MFDNKCGSICKIQ